MFWLNIRNSIIQTFRDLTVTMTFHFFKIQKDVVFLIFLEKYTVRAYVPRPERQVDEHRTIADNNKMISCTRNGNIDPSSVTVVKESNYSIIHINIKLN
jgi:hypothetical protein